VTFAFKKYHDLETRVKDHSISLEMTPFDKSNLNSYSHSIVTLAIVCTISDYILAITTPCDAYNYNPCDTPCDKLFI